MIIEGNDKANWLQGSEEADEIYGYGRNDTIEAGAGNDHVEGGDGDDSILAGAGDDEVWDGDGSNWVDGGDGDDWLSGAWNSTLLGSGGDDTLLGGDGEGDVAFRGGPGQDRLELYGGSGELDGGSADDFIFIHQVYGYETISAEGGSGSDRIEMSCSSLNDTTVDLRPMQAGGSVTAGGVTLSGFEHGAFRFEGYNLKIIAGDLAFDIETIDGADTLIGGAADNLLSSGIGNDVLEGRGGDDTLFGSEGRDVLDGGRGSDLAIFDHHLSLNINLGLSRPQEGGYGRDQLISIENIIGGSDGDRLTGNAADNRLQDIRSGYGGYDGHDTLSGGDGDDTLVAKLGSDADRLIGGAGADRFSFFTDDGSSYEAMDVLVDLRAEDTIDVSAVNAIAWSPEDTAFTLVSRLTGEAGQAALKYRAGPDKTYLLLDTDGDGVANHTVVMDGDQRDFTNLIL